MASLFIFATFSLSLLSMTSHADLISDVCSASQHPTFCTLTLRSDPAAQAAADLRSLGTVVAGKAKVASQAIQDTAREISGRIADTCVEVTGNAIGYLDLVLGYLAKPGNGSKDDILTKGSAALSKLDTCDDEFGNLEPGNLKEATAKAERLVSIVLTIGNKL